jgi:hypothetical protein
MTSSELQLEQTGVDRDEGLIFAGTGAAESAVTSNGLTNVALRILSIAPNVRYRTYSDWEPSKSYK